MALQDLTPQLRTRLTRVEKAVGWFVLLAVLLLVFGFGYYLYNTAKNKGWFIQKVNYMTGLNNAAGINIGDPVMLMGFKAGQVTGIVPNDPWAPFGVTIFFQVKKPDFGYIWSDSTVKTTTDFLGNRVLEITKGAYGVPTVVETTNKVAVAMLQHDYFEKELNLLLKLEVSTNDALGLLNDQAKTNQSAFYADIQKNSAYWLTPAESPALTERLDRIVSQVESALPNFLALTNPLNRVLTNSAHITANLDVISSNLMPVSADVAAITTQLREPGALGDWAMGTNFADQLDATLSQSRTLMDNTDSNLTALAEQITVTLNNLADITSNLNWQVQQNTNMLGSISDAVVHADGFVQGLKHHWLLRSAFKTPKTNAPPKEFKVLRSPRDASQH